MSTLRTDRLLTLYVVRYLKQLFVAENKRIPILMYHSISDDDEQRIHPYFKICTAPAVFAKHMSFLYHNNYRVINLNDTLKHLHSDNKLKEKYVALTFDDGFQDFYSNAFHILDKYHFTATVFLPTGLIENQNLKLLGKDHLNWQEVRELSKNGVMFGSHSVTHPQLRLMAKDNIENEIRKSKETIENKIGKSVNSFSYPCRFPEEQKPYTNYLKKILEKYCYLNGVTTRIGLARKDDDIHFLRRIPLNSYDDLPFFKTKLEGCYDWLYRTQYIYELLKSKYKINNNFSSIQWE
jgi:peptidoglycan/xylan/chitin deacetylase (PgdA/CDA1 family)